MCPIATNKGKRALSRWRQLDDNDKEWSCKISQIELTIENTFAYLFEKAWKLVKRKPGRICSNPRVKHPLIILAASILHNLVILRSGRGLFDGPNLMYTRDG